VGLAAIWAVVATGGDEESMEPSRESVSRPTADEMAVPPTVARRLVMPVFDGLVVPTLPTIGSAGDVRIDSAVLAGPVRELTADVPRRSTTHVELGYAGYTVDVTILRDPVNDRYEISLDTGSGPSWAVIDVPSATVYYSADRQEWVSTDDRIALDGQPDARMGDLYARLLDGPLRPDTLGAATVDSRGVAQLADGRSADAFTIGLPGSVIPLWQLYYLTPRSEFDPNDWPTSLVYDVYLADGVEVVVGISDVGGIAQVVRHELQLLPSPITVALPERGLVDIDPADD
jgi:hypothetical protein